MSHKFETLLYAIIFTIWVVRIYYKLYDKKIRKYVLCIGLLIVFWMIIRILKGVTTITILKRMSWYLYYIPLIFAPTLFYISSLTISSEITKRKKVIIYSISFILTLLVLTNDLHQLTFKFPNGMSDYDTYKHQVIYYLISIWIFYLFGKGMLKLAKNRLQIKKDKKVYLPLLVLLIGIIYTILYVIDIKYIRDINMSVMNSILICFGMELIFYLDLIPNNRKYLKTFENSSLDMLLVSLDGKEIYHTKSLLSLPQNILEDIINKNAKAKYTKHNCQLEVKKNKDSYVIIKKDLTHLNSLKKQVEKKRKELLKQQESIKLEEKTKKELYKIKIRKETISKIEKQLDIKKLEAKKILSQSNISSNDLEKVKRIIIYSKKKSSLIISELNNEIYSAENTKIILNELISSMSSLNITGLTIIKSNIMMEANTLSIIYDLIYETLENVNNTAVIVYLSSKNNEITLKITTGLSKKIKSNLNIPKNIKCTEKIYDTDTELIFKIKGEL